MHWLEAVILRVAHMGPWGIALFMATYVAAAITLAPAFKPGGACSETLGQHVADCSVGGDHLKGIYTRRLATSAGFAVLTGCSIGSPARIRPTTLGSAIGCNRFFQRNAAHCACLPASPANSSVKPTGQPEGTSSLRRAKVASMASCICA